MPAQDLHLVTPKHKKRRKPKRDHDIDLNLDHLVKSIEKVAHDVKAGVHITKKEHRQGVFTGEAKPKTKHEHHLAKKGRHTRSILNPKLALHPYEDREKTTKAFKSQKAQDQLWKLRKVPNVALRQSQISQLKNQLNSLNKQKPKTKVDRVNIEAQKERIQSDIHRLSRVAAQTNVNRLRKEAKDYRGGRDTTKEGRRVYQRAIHKQQRIVEQEREARQKGKGVRHRAIKSAKDLNTELATKKAAIKGAETLDDIRNAGVNIRVEVAPGKFRNLGEGKRSTSKYYGTDEKREQEIMEKQGPMGVARYRHRHAGRPINYQSVKVQNPYTKKWHKTKLEGGEFLTKDDVITLGLLLAPIPGVGAVRALASGSKIAERAVAGVEAGSAALKNIPLRIASKLGARGAAPAAKAAARGAERAAEGARGVKAGATTRAASEAARTAPRGSERVAAKTAKPHITPKASTRSVAASPKAEDLLTKMKAIDESAVKATKATTAKEAAKHIDDVITGAAKIVDRPISLVLDHVPNAMRNLVVSSARGLPRSWDEAKLAALQRPAIAAGLATTVPVAAAMPASAYETIYRDTYDIIAGFVPSTYELGAAGFEAIHGDYDRANTIWEGIKKTDPIALAIQGDWEAAQKAWEERPVSALLEVAGGEYALGRAAGATLRRIPATRAFADTQRLTPLLPEGEGQGGLQIDRYSPDIFRHKTQVLGERLGLGNERTITFAGETYNVGRVSHARNRRVDEMQGVKRGDRVARANEVMRSYDKHLRKAQKIDDRAPHVLSLMGTRVLRPGRELRDLSEYITSLERERAALVKRNQTDSPEYAFIDHNIKLLEGLAERPGIFSDSRIQALVADIAKREGKRQSDLVSEGALAPAQAEIARWVPYAVRHMKATFKNNKWHINGKALSNERFLERVKQHAKDSGIDEPMFVSLQHQGDPLLSTTKGKLPTVRFHKRSHDAIKQGMWDMSFNGLGQSALRSESLISESRYIRDLVDTFGIRKRVDGEYKFFKLGEAKRLKDKMHAEDHEMVLFNVTAYSKQLHDFHSVGSARGQVRQGDIFNEALEAAQKSKPDGDSYVLIPEDVLQRIVAHAKAEQAVSPFMRVATREFKAGVLPLNPRWQLGNTVDMTLRMLIDGMQTNPLDFARGISIAKRLKRIDEAAYNDLMERMGTGMLSESWRRIHEDYGTVSKREAQRRLQEQSDWLSEVFNSPQGRFNAVLRSYRLFQAGGFYLARNIERGARLTSLGRETVRHLEDLQGSWIKASLMQDSVLEEVALGLRNTDLQSKFARHINKTLGDYSSLTPKMRRATLSYAPFALWMKASLGWVMTLPARHPMQTAVMASVNRWTEQERRLLGLSMLRPIQSAAEAGVGFEMETKPSYLMGAINIDEQLIPTQTLTSFGTLYDLPGAASEAIIPQFRGPLFNLVGLQWTGDRLVRPDGSDVGEIEKAGIALSSIIETYIPAARWFKTSMAEGAPGPTATLWNWKPQGKRDINISPTGQRYQAAALPGMEVLRNITLPHITPVQAPERRQISDARYGMSAIGRKAAAREERKALPSYMRGIAGDEKLPSLTAGSKRKKERSTSTSTVPSYMKGIVK